VILSLRDAFHKDALGVIRGRPETKSLLGSEGWITDEVLWSCTSCGACVKNCPVLIEHLDTIVDLRRFLVSESRVDDLLQDTLAKIGRYGNSFGQSERSRSKWAQSLPIKIKDARREPVEYLWFVGDYASFNPTVVETTRRIAQIFQNAGVDFGILYEAERNSGNDVRRVGEEGLYEMLVEKNFKSVVTSDPHSYHALRREYPSEALAGRPVQHYSELLDQLISSGKLKLSKKLGYSVTYHDPCYLGRYNQVYDAPRRVIEACGCQVVEMPRCRENALCCNAGGGQIWIKEGEMNERPSENRIREAAALAGVGVFVVACPKDLTMYLDAVKTTSLEAKLAVKDLIDLVFEAL
jgi:Fe-S oxidoreductase